MSKRPEWKNRAIRAWGLWYRERVRYGQRPPRRVRRAWGAHNRDPIADICKAMENAKLYTLRLDTMVFYQPKEIAKIGLL